MNMYEFDGELWLADGWQVSVGCCKERAEAISLEELIVDLKDAVDEGFELGYSNEPYDVTDCDGYENYGKFQAYKYILDIITWGIK